IVHPVNYSVKAGNQTVTLPELADGGGWSSDVVLVNTSEDRMNGEVRFLTQGSGTNPGTPLVLGIGDGTSTSSVVEFDIPPRSFQKVSTAGSSTSPQTPFALTSGTSITTPGAGPFQISGWGSADSNSADTRLNGLQIIQYRQLGITQSET